MTEGETPVEGVVHDIVEQAAAAVVCLDADFRAVYANFSARVLFGGNPPQTVAEWSSTLGDEFTEYCRESARTAGKGQPGFKVTVEGRPFAAYASASSGKLLIHFEETSVQANADCGLLVKAVVEAGMALVSGKRFKQSLGKCLKTVGEVVGSSRVAVWRRPGESAGDGPEVIAEFRGAQGTFESALDWDRLAADWAPSFLRREPVVAPTDGRTVLLVPIYADDVWWGLLGLDGGADGIPRTASDVACLRLLAGIIGRVVARTLAEEAQREREQLHRTIVDCSDDVIYSLEIGGGFLYAGPGWLRALGRRPEDVVGMRPDELIHAEDLKDFRKYVKAREKHPEVGGDVEYRIRHADGSWRYHSMSGSVVENIQGVAKAFVGIAKDVTDRAVYEAKLWEVTEELTQANRDLTVARDEALEASRAKSRFLANMSHEIRTPLNGVIGLTSLMLQKDLDEDSTEIIQAVQCSGESLLRIIDDILDFSKIEAGKLDIEPAPVEIGELVAGVVSLYQGQALAKGVKLGQKPPCPLPPIVLTDATRLRQVLANLVSNAVKFTQEGSADVVWEWTQDGDRVDFEFRVTDTGVGIPADRIEAVFQRFMQADNSTQRRFGGSGLGLAICRHLLDLMGGSLQVRSKEGAGSTFTVKLKTKAAGTRVPVQKAEAVDWSLLARKQLSVLLAEDNPVNVMVARRLLEKCGCKVEVAEDGNVACTKTAGTDYDVVLMDMQMPNCDGLEATRRIREREAGEGRRQIVVALTANAMAEDRQICFEAGMDDFLAKPITMGALAELLLRWSDRGEEAA